MAICETVVPFTRVWSQITHTERSYKGERLGNMIERGHIWRLGRLGGWKGRRGGDDLGRSVKGWRVRMRNKVVLISRLNDREANHVPASEVL